MRVSERPTTKPPRALMFLLVVLGAALRIWQWAAGASLWLDEIVLTRNIIARSAPELLAHPLAFDQVAPLGFLAVVKWTTQLFGTSERALWLLPFLCGLASLVLFRHLAERMLGGLSAIVALAWFALALPLIRYSSEVKQYGIDALAAVGLTLLIFELRGRNATTRALLLAGAAGLGVIWFSQASAIIMAGLGSALAIAWLFERDRPTARILIYTMPLWAVASALVVLLGHRSMTQSTRAFMDDFWRGGFLPLPPSLSLFSWIWDRIASIFGDPWTLQYPLPWLFTLLAAGGWIVLWRRDRATALLCVAPLAMTLLAAIAQQYPFRSRLIVFLVPGALIAAAAGVGWLAETVGRLRREAGWIVVLLAIVPAVITLMRVGLPARVDDYPPLYRHLQTHREPGDAVLVSFLATSSAIYYGPRYGLARGDFAIGACDQKDARIFVRALDRFRGQRRLWVLTKNVPPLHVPNEAVRTYLSTIGTRREVVATRSAVNHQLTLELYDLSDPLRLRAASAETFPVGKMPRYPRPGCRDWSGEAALTTALAR
jgi:hypothetical protein